MSHNIYTSNQLYKEQQRKINHLRNIIIKFIKLDDTISSITTKNAPKAVKEECLKSKQTMFMDCIAIHDILSRIIGTLKDDTNLNKKEKLQIAQSFTEFMAEVENG